MLEIGVTALSDRAVTVMSVVSFTGGLTALAAIGSQSAKSRAPAVFSSGCSGYLTFFLSSSLVRSHMVSVNKQKKGGESVHPIGRTRGNATDGNPGNGGSNTLSFFTPDMDSVIWWNPSKISTL